MSCGAYDLVGTVLLLAAVSKAASAAGFELPLPGYTRWLLVFVEGAIGIACFLVPNRAWFKWMLGGLLLTFAGFTAHGALRGRNTCGCFGAAQIPPVFAMILDLVLAATVLSLPKPSRIPLRRRATWLILLLVGGGLTLNHLMRRPSLAQGPASSQPTTRPVGSVFTLTLGESDERIADLASVAADTSRLVALDIHNPFDRQVKIRVDEIECVCTKVRESPNLIPAGGSARFVIEFHAPRESMRYNKSIRFWTNAPAGNSLRLIIRAEITGENVSR